MITAGGALALTPDVVLLRLVSADPWTIVFWRGVLMAAGLGLGLGLAYRGRVLDICRGIGATGLWVALFYGIEAVLFVLALVNTSVANTVIIVATAPLFAALMSWAFLGEHIPGRTWVAILAVVVGIAVVMGDGMSLGTAWGDLAAVASGTAFAGALVLVRHARHADMLPATALGGLLSAVAVLPFAAPFAMAPSDILPLFTTGLVILPLAFGAFTIGPRYIAAPEVGLLMLLQAVLSPMLVWIFLGEAMTVPGLVGGVIVIGTLAVHSAMGLRLTNSG